MEEVKKSPCILLANLSKAWGGGEQWFLWVGNALSERGFDVHMLIYPGGELEKRLSGKGLRVYKAKLRFLSWLHPGKIIQMRKILHEVQPQFVLMNASHELKTMGLMAHLMGIPHIIFRRGVSYPLKKNFLNRWFIKRVSTAFVANSHATLNAFSAAFPIILHRPHLRLNNGIPLKNWHPNHSQRKALRIGMSARLSHEKGIDRAIEAMHLLKQKAVDAELLIFGEGLDRDRLEGLIQEKKLENSVFLKGFTQDVQAQLNQCSIFLFTPRFGEGTSIALIEAMSLELPCVVFDTPAMSEVVLDGETGFVVPDGNIEMLAERLESLLGNKEMCLRMGKAARQRALAHFGLEKQVVAPLKEWLLSL